MIEVAKFAGVEQLEGAARDTGWDIEYRQLRGGNFASWFASYECGGVHLATEELDNRLQVCCEPPTGFFGIMLPLFPTGESKALGRKHQLGDLIVFPRDSELEIITSGRMQNFTLFLSEEDFIAAARVIAPGARIFTPRSASVHRGSPGPVAVLQRRMAAVFASEGQGDEVLSNILASTILWLADAGPQPREVCLGHSSALAVALRARDYIEAHFHETIRVQELCACTGTGLRTLERCFASHYQISPIAYIKARRLNEARRELLALDPRLFRVADIALSNGLPHLGRFSAEYKRFFGELPSQTALRGTSERASGGH